MYAPDSVMMSKNGHTLIHFLLSLWSERKKETSQFTQMILMDELPQLSYCTLPALMPAVIMPEQCLQLTGCRIFSTTNFQPDSINKSQFSKWLLLSRQKNQLLDFWLIPLNCLKFFQCMASFVAGQWLKTLKHLDQINSQTVSIARRKGQQWWPLWKVSFNMPKIVISTVGVWKNVF